MIPLLFYIVDFDTALALCVIGMVLLGGTPFIQKGHVSPGARASGLAALRGLFLLAPLHCTSATGTAITGSARVWVFVCASPFCLFAMFPCGFPLVSYVWLVCCSSLLSYQRSDCNFIVCSSKLATHSGAWSFEAKDNRKSWQAARVKERTRLQPPSSDNRPTATRGISGMWYSIVRPTTSRTNPVWERDRLALSPAWSTVLACASILIP